MSVLSALLIEPAPRELGQKKEVSEKFISTFQAEGSMLW